MVHLGTHIILQYQQFIEWTESLREMDEQTWSSPVGEGKVSAADIISHLRNWDAYLIHIIIPAIKNGEGMLFPDFDSFNQVAYDYARSGVSLNRLLDEFKQTRMQLTALMLAEPDVTTKEVTANGVERCPHTDTPYSLLYIIYEFIAHDRHHKDQILSIM